MRKRKHMEIKPSQKPYQNQLEQCSAWQCIASYLPLKGICRLLQCNHNIKNRYWIVFLQRAQWTMHQLKRLPKQEQDKIKSMYYSHSCKKFPKWIERIFFDQDVDI
jgi:hypothetical protein